MEYHEYRFTTEGCMMANYQHKTRSCKCPTIVEKSGQFYDDGVPFFQRHLNGGSSSRRKGLFIKNNSKPRRPLQSWKGIR